MPDDQLTRIEKKVDHISDWIEGNGKPGAKMMLDRHNRDLAVGKCFAFVVAVAVIGLAVGASWQAMLAHAG